MNIPTLEEMLQAGIHFGHTTSRWHPKMEQFIFTTRGNVHIIDLQKTQDQLKQVLPAVKKMAAEGKKILFVTTKPQARDIVKDSALACNQPYLVDRWIGGMLTNFDEIKKLIKKYVELKGKKEKGELDQYTKKEQLELTRELEKMGTYLEGLSDLDKMPDALFIPALQREKTAVREANRLNVPIIGVCDTNANPDTAQYVIPANDDAVKSIAMIIQAVSEAIKEGAKEFATKQEQEKKVADEKK